MADKKSEMSEEIEDMLESSPEVEETPREEKPRDEPIIKEEEEELEDSDLEGDEDSSEKESEDEEKEVKESKEEPEKEKEETEGDEISLKEENQKLRELINEVSKGRLTGKAPKTSEEVSEKEKPTPKDEPKKEFPEQVRGQDVDYFSKEQLDSFIDHPEIINQGLNAVRRSAIESVMSYLPEMVTTMLDNQRQIDSVVSDFYDQNDDLVPYKDFVSMVAKGVEEKNPGWEYDKILDETVVTVRERLRLGKKADEVKPRRPAFAKGGKKGRPAASSKKSVNTLQDELDEMLK